MPQKPVKKLSATDKAKLLRTFGYKVKFGTRKKGTNSPQYKSAATRAWNKIAPYVASTRQTFKFVPLKKSARKAVVPKQRTPAGIFAHVPRGTDPKKFKFRVDENGVIHEKARGPRGGIRNEETYPIDPTHLADDPVAALKKILKGKKKPSGLRMVVNGNDAVNLSGEHGYSLSVFFDYFPDLMEKLQDPENYEEQRKKHGDRALDADEIPDIFQVKLIYQTKSKKKSAPSKRGNKKHAVTKKTHQRR